MEDVKDYLERTEDEIWEHLNNKEPLFLEEIEGEEITTDAMSEIIIKDLLNNEERE